MGSVGIPMPKPGLGINLAGSAWLLLCPCISSFKAAAHPAHTHSLTHTALSSRVLSCLANAVQIEGAIHLLTVPKSKGGENTLAKQTASPESPREKRFLRLYRNTCKRHTHTHEESSVCNSSLYLRARGLWLPFFFFFKRLSKQS